MKRTILAFFVVFCGCVEAKAQGMLLDSNIRSIKLYKPGDQTSLPILQLGVSEGLELDFDDLDDRFKNYYFTFQLCNADWSPSLLHPFEYIKGFQNARITNYRNSSLATVRYVHYQAMVPDRNCYPSRSGNYLLKVFLNNDTNQLAFTRRMMVIENKASVSTQLLQPYNSSLFRTAQKVSIGVQTDSRLQVMSPGDLKVVLMQNNNWVTSVYMDKPTIFRGNYYEYSDENLVAMPAGKEFRWVDLRSLRLLSDRMRFMNTHADTTTVEMKPDPDRSGMQYVYYRDLNGSYTIETSESINPFWQGDYAWVHFTYAPPGNRAIGGSDVYLFGEMTNYATDTSGRMIFNPDAGVYERTLFLKQGYYNYAYIIRPYGTNGYPDFSHTEGNYYGTENTYTVLVYYRSFGSRADELVGYASLNTIQ